MIDNYKTFLLWFLLSVAMRTAINYIIFLYQLRIKAWLLSRNTQAVGVSFFTCSISAYGLINSSELATYTQLVASLAVIYIVSFFLVWLGALASDLAYHPTIKSRG